MTMNSLITPPRPAAAAEPATQAPERAAPRTLRVLLGHGDRAELRRLRGALRHAGFDVAAFESGFDLVGHAQPWVFRGAEVEPPDAIVCAANLADWSAAEVLRILRAGDDRTPVIALVANDHAGMRARLFALGADAVRRADLDGAELAELVDTLVTGAGGAGGWRHAA